MDGPRVQWGNSDAIRMRALWAWFTLSVGLMVLIAIPIVASLDPVGSMRAGYGSAAILAGSMVFAVIGLGAGVVGFRMSLLLRATYWLELKTTGLELWRGNARRPVHLIPWTGIAAVQATVDPEPVLWLRREPRAVPTPGSELDKLGGRLPAVTGGFAEWDLGIELDPVCGDPRNLERELAARVRAPR